MSDNRFPPMGQPRQHGPGPYGAPQGSYAPPGPAWHGQPGQPPQAPWPHPGAPRPDGGRGRRVAISVVLAVVLMAGAGGVWWWLSGSGSGGSDGSGGGGGAATEAWNAGVKELGAAEELWRVTEGDSPSSLKVGDHWVTDEHLVRRLAGRVVAYELTTGKVAWELPLSGDATATCPSSREQTTRVALLLSTQESAAGAECGRLSVVDISAGKEVVTTDLPSGKGNDVPVVFGERVVVPGDQGARVFDLNSGQVLQDVQPGARCVSERAAVFGELLLASQVCAPDEDEPAVNRLRALDANLQTVWEWATPPDGEGRPSWLEGVVSADPLVVDLRHDNGLSLLKVDPASGETVTLDEAASHGVATYALPCDGMALGSCQQVKVVDGKVVQTTVPLQVNPGDEDASPGMRSTEFRTELVAVDVNTGKEAWRTGIADGRAVHLVPTADESIVAFQSANFNGAKAMLYSVDAGSGTLAPLLPISQKAHDDETLCCGNGLSTGKFGQENWQAVWRDGVFVMFKMIHRDENKGEVESVAFALP